MTAPYPFPILAAVAVPRPLLRQFNGYEPLTRQYGNRLVEAMNTQPPVYWYVQQVGSYLDDLRPLGADGQSQPLITDQLPMRPPVDAIWLEWMSGGEANAVFLHRQADQVWKAHVLVAPRGDRPVLLPMEGHVSFHEDGTLDQLQYGWLEHSDVPDPTEAMTVVFSFRVLSTLTAFVFAQCGNVVVIDRVPRRHEQRQAARDGRPAVRYQEVAIDPQRTRAIADALVASSNGPDRVMRIAGGYFAHYTQELPMFGKYVGTYWIPAHHAAPTSAAVGAGAVRALVPA